MKHKVFVYGTLKKGLHYHKEYLSNATFLGDFRTNGGFSLYVSGLPFLVKEKNDGSVYGELYEVTLPELAYIDILEGHPHAYEREIISIHNDDGVIEEAWAYIYPHIFKNKAVYGEKKDEYSSD